MTEGRFHYPESGDLVDLADRIAESNAAPDPQLFALIAKTALERRNMSQQELLHYRRMMALQFELITNTSEESGYTPEEWAAVQFLFGTQLSELRTFKVDLSNLNQTWNDALSEVLNLYGDPNQPRVAGV